MRIYLFISCKRGEISLHRCMGVCILFSLSLSLSLSLVYIYIYIYYIYIYIRRAAYTRRIAWGLVLKDRNLG